MAVFSLSLSLGAASINILQIRQLGTCTALPLASPNLHKKRSRIVQSERSEDNKRTLGRARERTAAGARLCGCAGMSNLDRAHVSPRRRAFAIRTETY